MLDRPGDLPGHAGALKNPTVVEVLAGRDQRRRLRRDSGDRPGAIAARNRWGLVTM
jgi:hypothetical protein